MSNCWWLFLFALMTGYKAQYPDSEYAHSLARDQMVRADMEYGGKNFTMTEEERIANNYLNYMKINEFLRTKDDFPPSRPIELMMGNITSSPVYQLLYKLPKGGNMHTHENHMLSKSILLDLVWNSSDFQHLYVRNPESTDSPWKLDFFLDPPDADWINVAGSSYTKDEILEQQVLLGILSDYSKQRPTDTSSRWKDIDPLWERGSVQLICNINIKKAYVKQLLIEALKEGTQYVESRKHLGPDETIYELNYDCEQPLGNGKCRLGDAELDISLTQEAITEMEEEYSEFIGLRRIVYSFRRKRQESIAEEMNRVVNLSRAYPTQVVAFDMVGEEDLGYSHLYFLDNFIGLSEGDGGGESRVDVKFHTAETSWPEDLITAADFDPVSTANNAYESLLLQTSRVGHGVAYIKHPYMLQVIKDRGLAIEVCPVSNQLLGYFPDLRHHPAINYMRQGIPIALGSDDAGTFGVDYFTLDWYEAFMAWGLDLIDLRQLAINSLRYSSMSPEETEDAIEGKWRPVWNNFVIDVMSIACEEAFDPELATFARIVPRDGAIDAPTRVHVYGRHFEAAICSTVVCKFGEQESSSARYVSTSHVECDTPLPTYNVHGSLRLMDDVYVNVSVSLDGGETFLNTGETFVYRHITDAPPTSLGNGNKVVAPSAHLILLVSWVILFAKK